MDIVFLGRLDRTLRRAGVKTALALFVLLASCTILGKNTTTSLPTHTNGSERELVSGLYRAPTNTPSMTINAFYEWYLEQATSDSVLAAGTVPYVTTTFQSPSQGMACLPVMPDTITIDGTARSGDAATVTVTSYQYNKGTLYTVGVVRINDQWRISDIRCPSSDRSPLPL